MKAFKYPSKGFFFVRLKSGDDLLLSLRQAVQENGIRNAVIAMGMGSVKSYHFHLVDGSVNPPPEVFRKSAMPADILNVNGLVIDGRVHAHITLSDAKVAFGGHLEEGCEILTFSVIALAEIDDADFTDWDAVGL